MSFVMRSAGVGEGRGEGVGVGVCAAAGKGKLEIARPAAPAAGRSLTNVRRLISDLSLSLGAFFFIESFAYQINGCHAHSSPVGTECLLIHLHSRLPAP